MKKFLAILVLIFFIITTSISLEFYECSKNVVVEGPPTVVDYVDAQIAIKRTVDLLEEHGYYKPLRGKLVFDQDPLGNFKDETQMGYTIGATRTAYIRSYANLNALNSDHFYNTNNLYKYHAFNRSIMVHELTHVVLFYHNVRGTAIHEFAAYYFGLLSLPPKLMHKILEANKEAVAFDSEKSAFCPLWYFVGYYPAVQAYLYWKKQTPEERKILFKKIVDCKFIQRSIGE